MFYKLYLLYRGADAEARPPLNDVIYTQIHKRETEFEDVVKIKPII